MLTRPIGFSSNIQRTSLRFGNELPTGSPQESGKPSGTPETIQQRMERRRQDQLAQQQKEAERIQLAQKQLEQELLLNRLKAYGITALVVSLCGAVIALNHFLYKDDPAQTPPQNSSTTPGDVRKQ